MFCTCFVFSKGVILTTNELNRYADVPGNEQVWTRGRYSLVIDVKSIDGIQNDVLVSAKVEGRSENGIFSEWSTLSSSGEAEEEFLSQLVVNKKFILGPSLCSWIMQTF